VHDALRRFKADIFQALAHPTRIAIVELLGEGNSPLESLIERLGIEQATVFAASGRLRAKQSW